MTSFNEMPGHSRVWIYQCDRFFSESEVKMIEEWSSQFLQSWDYHGQKLQSAFKLIYNKFIVLAVDEKIAPVGGCSIDKSIAFIKEIEKQFNVGFFDRTLIAYKSGEEIRQEKMHEFWALRKAHHVTEDTVVFNNLVKTLEEFNSDWEVPFKNSWHNDMW